MRQLLVVAPSFPPVNSADMHRVRLSVPFYAEHGWAPHVLTISPDQHDGLSDPDLVRTLPQGLPLIECGALPRPLTGLVGVRNAGLRALGHLYRAGARAIRDRRIDLVYFSTTMFPVMTLGRLWQVRFGTPYVLDMQDPWKTDYRGAGTTSGLRARAARWLHGVLEPFAMRGVAGLTAVSPAYIETLRHRYPWIGDRPAACVPFGASPTDFEAAQALPFVNRFFGRAEGHLVGLAVGRGGRDLSAAAARLFSAVRLLSDRAPGLAAPQLVFVGTDYAAPGREQRTIEPVAQRCRAEQFVREFPSRVGYLHALRLLLEADFAVVLGSDDTAYSPSKVYPYLLSGRPIVAVLPEGSPAADVLRRAGTAFVHSFRNGPAGSAEIATLAEGLERFLARPTARADSSAELLAGIHARTLTGQQCAVFDAAVAARRPLEAKCPA